VIQIVEERCGDADAIEQLLDLAFGPKRKRKISYRFRQRLPPIAGMSFVALDGDVLAGTIRHWPIVIVGEDGVQTPAVLLGPLAVASEYRGYSIGAQLMQAGLATTRAARCSVVILVGDLPYYGRFGFRPAADFGIVMPNEKPARVLALPLDDVTAIRAGTIRHSSYQGTGARRVSAA
jgi:predicted N-acetyltransferase YhbS